MTDERINSLVLDALKAFAENEGIPALSKADKNTVLYGEGGCLDSLALVSLIADLETAVEEKLGKQVVLADERAMSRRRSPFHTVGTLAEYVEEMVK